MTTQRPVNLLPARFCAAREHGVALALGRCDFLQQLPTAREPLGRQLAAHDGCEHGAIGLALVRAVAKPAALGERGDVGLLEAARQVLVEEAFGADAGGEALHGDRPPANVRQHRRRHEVVVPGQLRLRDPVVGEQHLLGMCDHGISRTTARGSLS